MADFAAIIIGAEDHPHRAGLQDELRGRTASLQESNEQLHLIDQDTIGTAMPSGAIAMAVVLCRKGMSPVEISAINECKKRKIPIIPVVASLSDFTTVAPAEVANFNGFQLTDAADTGELAGLVLESMGLQRSKRKIFISYARMDSSRAAQQLREAFTARWYSVFLDTISIRPGAAFQEELMQELADSDAVVLLNSPNAQHRPFVKDEIAFVDQAALSGVEVIWPRVPRMREGAFFTPIELDSQLATIDDGAVTLTARGIQEIVRKVADMRTTMQGIRERQMLEPIKDYARNKGWRAVTYLGRYVELSDGRDTIRLDMALGVPTSFDLERAFTARRLVFDPLGITNRQADHLDFLGSKLQLDYLDPKTTLQWTII